MRTNPNRLPSHTTPTKYQITIIPDLANFIFEGKEKIHLLVSKPTNELVLHSVDIKVFKAEVKIGKEVYLVKSITYQSKTETVTLKLPKKISGKVLLSLEFTGAINDQLRGFYRSKYLHKKEEKFLATTQFEATDARRAFPCFDEPAHKAIFEVSVIVPKNLKVISNTTESSVRAHEAGLKIVDFTPTPKMSTYLLALIIGEFEHLQTKSKRGVQIRVHTTPGKKEQGKFALDVAKRSLDFLEDYFNIPFPLPVLDLIAIPDFSAGAMENWGAITFRETALLVDDQHTSFLGKQRVAEVISHELVHQWFGNLVTMEWWTHLWLNESFATYMAYLATDELFPKWNFWTKFVLNEQSEAMYADSLKSTQPIEVEVNHPDEISEAFDPAIVYAKGASVLRMLASYVGADNFREGLRLYLKKHSYKNTSSIDLWDAFEKVSGLPVRKFMKIWTTEQGFPVVFASVKNDRLLLEQKKFSHLPSSSKTIWGIPALTDQTKAPAVLGKVKDSYALKSDYDFIKLNLGESGFFITDYSISLLAKLLPELQKKTFSSVDRLAIIRNALLLVKAGHLSTDVYLEIISFLREDNSYIVWAEIDSGMEQIARMVSGTSVEPKFKEYKANLFGSLLDSEVVGFKAKKAEAESISILRGLALLESGLAGYKNSIAFSKKLFAQKLAGKSVPADLRLAVYSTVARHGNKQTFDILISIYKKTSNPQEKQQVLFAMTKFIGNELQKKVMNFMFSDEVRGQDKPFVLSHALNNPYFKNVAWMAIQDKWDSLVKEFSGSRLLGVIISGARGFSSQAEQKSFEKFINSHPVPGSKLTIAKTKEIIQINVAWQTRDLKLVGRYLA